MRSVAVLLATLFLRLAVATASPVGADQVRIALDDGTVISGTVKPETITVSTAYGDIKVRPSAIREVAPVRANLNDYVVHGKVEGERTDFVDGVPESLVRILTRVTRTVECFSCGGPERQRAAPWLYPLSGKYPELPRVVVENGKKYYPIRGTWRRVFASGVHHYDENNVLVDKSEKEVLPHHSSKVDFYVVPAVKPLDSAPLAENTPFLLVLKLSDGTTLRGKTDSRITLHTRFGKLTVPLRHVRSAAFVDKTSGGETWREARLELHNGDRLRGVSKDTKLVLKTPYGTLTIPLAGISKIERLALELPADLRKGLLLHCDFDAPPEKTVRGVSGKGNRVKVHGAIWKSNGKVGGAYEFDGKDDFIELGPSNTYSAHGQLSACAWIRRKDRAIIVLSNYRGGSSYSGQFMFAIDSEGILDVAFGQGPGQFLRYRAAEADLVRAGKWHHVAFSYDERRGKGRKVKLYIDGKELGKCFIQGEDTGGPVLKTSDRLHIMAHRDRRPGCFSRGIIDEVMIFNRALSDGEIKQIRNLQK